MYSVSDNNVAEANAKIASDGLDIYFERVSNYSVQITAGVSSFTYTFPVQNITSLKSVVALMIPKANVNSGLRDRYCFGDGSADRDTESTTRAVSSVQYSIGNQYYPNAPLNVGPYQMATLHTIAKSAMFGDGAIVYHTDSNHVENYAGELDGVYKGRLADKFMMNMSFVQLNGKSVQSGLPLVNSPLTAYLNFSNSGPAEDMVLHVFLIHDAKLVLTASDVAIRF